MRWFLSLGALGLSGFVAEAVDERFPDGLLFAAFLSCIVATYGVIILRGRNRGESPVESLRIRYGARLTRFERVMWTSLGWGLLALSYPFTLTLSSAGTALLACFAVVIGLSGRPPFRTSPPGDGRVQE